MADNLAPIVTANDIPTKKYVDDSVATAEEVAISATTPAVIRELWVDTAAAAADVVTRVEFNALMVRIAALEAIVVGDEA